MDEAELSKNEQLTPPDGSNLWFRWIRVSLLRGTVVFEHFFCEPEPAEAPRSFAQFGLN
jgi:hypothetical protein